MATKKQTRGDGVFKIRGDKIYVHGTINGKFYRKSTGKKATPVNKTWIKKQDPLKVLAEIIGIHESTTSTSLKEVGIEAIELKYAATPNMTLNHHNDKLRTFNNRVLPYFEDIPMENISSKDIIRWINLLKEEYSFTHVKFIKNLFSSIFKYAVKDLRIIEYNPLDSELVKSIDLSWEAVTETYDTNEVMQILSESKGWFKIYIDLACKYGFRPGEMVAMKWEDFDLDNGLLYLKRTRNSDNKIKEFNKNSTKGKNKNHFRTIALQPTTLQLLKTYCEFRTNEEWLFINKDNQPFSKSQSVVDYHLKPLLKKLNIKYKTLYALRRSYASISIHTGVNLEDIQQVMGHSQGSVVTEKHYITDNVLTTEDRQNISAKEEENFYQKLENEEE